MSERRDDDRDDDLELPATPEELAQARKLGDLVDGLVARASAPAALAVEQRLLYETARDLYEAGPGLPVSRTRAVVDDVFASVAGATTTTDAAAGPPVTTVARAATPVLASVSDVVPLRARATAGRGPGNARGLRVWVVAGLAAAGLALALGGVLRAPGPPGAPTAPVAVVPVDPDALLGAPIPPTHAAQAGHRLDVLVAARQGALQQARHQHRGRGR